MLGFIDCGILAKEIMMLFPEEDNITPDIYSAIKSLSLIILGTDSNPSTSSHKNFCRTLRNIVEELFKLQHGESDEIINGESLNKLEDLAQQAINWRINFNNKNQAAEDNGQDDGEAKPGPSKADIGLGTDLRDKKKGGRPKSGNKSSTSKGKTKTDSAGQNSKKRKNDTSKAGTDEARIQKLWLERSKTNAIIIEEGEEPTYTSTNSVVKDHIVTDPTNIFDQVHAAIGSLPVPSDSEIVKLTSKMILSHGEEVEANQSPGIVDDEQESGIPIITDYMPANSQNESNETDVLFSTTESRVVDRTESITENKEIEPSSQTIDNTKDCVIQIDESNKTTTSAENVESNEVSADEDTDQDDTIEEIHDDDSIRFISPFESTYLRPRRAALAAKRKMESHRRVAKKSAEGIGENTPEMQGEKENMSPVQSELPANAPNVTKNTIDQPEVSQKEVITLESTPEESPGVSNVKRGRKLTKKMQESIMDSEKTQENNVGEISNTPKRKRASLGRIESSAKSGTSKTDNTKRQKQANNKSVSPMTKKTVIGKAPKSRNVDTKRSMKVTKKSLPKSKTVKKPSKMNAKQEKILSVSNASPTEKTSKEEQEEEDTKAPDEITKHSVTMATKQEPEVAKEIDCHTVTAINQKPIVSEVINYSATHPEAEEVQTVTDIYKPKHDFVPLVDHDSSSSRSEDDKDPDYSPCKKTRQSRANGKRLKFNTKASKSNGAKPGANIKMEAENSKPPLIDIKPIDIKPVKFQSLLSSGQLQQVFIMNPDGTLTAINTNSNHAFILPKNHHMVTLPRCSFRKLTSIVGSLNRETMLTDIRQNAMKISPPLRHILPFGKLQLQQQTNAVSIPQMNALTGKDPVTIKNESSMEDTTQTKSDSQTNPVLLNNESAVKAEPE